MRMRSLAQRLAWEGLYTDMSRTVGPELCDLVEELHDVKEKWYSIGIQLKVPVSTLKAIESNTKNVERAFCDMIEEWLKLTHTEPTWAVIVTALRSRSVGEGRLAKNLERRLCTPSAATPLEAADFTAIATWSANTASGSEQVLDPELRKEMDDLHQLFTQLRMDVYRFLNKESPPDLKEFRVFVSSPPPAWKIKQQKPLTEADLDRIMKSDEFHEIYMVLSQYMDWYNYELLNSIVEEYGNPEIKERMKEYRIRLDIFEKRTSLEEVKNIPLCQPQPDSVAYIVKMPTQQCNQFHLIENRRMQHALTDEANIDRAAVRTYMVLSNSVTIIFLVPLALAPYLMVSSVCPLLTSQEPLPEDVCDRCVQVIHTEEAFRLMGRPLPSARPALPAPPLHRSNISLSSSFSDDPRPKSISVLRPQPMLDPRHMQIFHNRVLDAGASTVVCEARLNHLPCVAKYVHPKLVESNEWPLEKFIEGCKFLESCHHPNIVPFLGMYYDDSLKVPVLLMEQMEQSLHNYLEQATHPVPIHTQLDICHDIAQGLEYIHSREYIHGDLTATNILLQRRRAKIGGMMTLQCKSPDAELSLCPGTPAYLPMKSFDSSDYDESIDCFSFGVLAIHIATGEIPSPISHTTKVSSEIERYSKSIAKVATGHPVHSMILQCLKDESSERPSAANLCIQLSFMKETPVYKTSLLSETLHVQLLNLQNHFLQQQLREKREEINITKQQHQVRLQREIESVKHQAKVETERMKANYQKEQEQVRSEAKRDIQEAQDEKNKFEKYLRCEIAQVNTTWSEKVKQEREEWKTKSEREQKMLKEQSYKLSVVMEEKDKLQRDMQARNEDLGGQVRDLELEKQLLREKLEAADQSYARLLQTQHGQ